MELIKVGKTYINLAAITYVKVQDDGCISVHFSEGDHVFFQGEDAEEILTWLKSSEKGPGRPLWSNP